MTLGRWVPFFFCYVKDSQWRRIAMRFQGGRDLAKMKPTWEIPDILYYGTDKVLWSRSQISTIFKPWRWDYIGDYMGITLFMHPRLCIWTFLIFYILAWIQIIHIKIAQEPIVLWHRQGLVVKVKEIKYFQTLAKGYIKRKTSFFSPVSSLRFCCSHLFV